MRKEDGEVGVQLDQVKAEVGDLLDLGSHVHVEISRTGRCRSCHHPASMLHICSMPKRKAISPPKLHDTSALVVHHGVPLVADGCSICLSMRGHNSRYLLAVGLVRTIIQVHTIDVVLSAFLSWEVRA